MDTRKVQNLICILNCLYATEEPATSIANDGERVTTDGCYEVIADYIKQSVNELTVYEGEVVCVIDNSDESKCGVNNLF